MKFHAIKPFWFTDFGTLDVSLGVHLCWDGRIDLHILTFMLSFGRVPIYVDRNGHKFAVSNSYHKDVNKRVPLRAGVPS